MAIKIAWIAGIVCGVTTVIFSLLNLLGYNEWNLLDAGIIFGLSFGVYKKNMACAVILFIYFIGAKVSQIYEGDPLTSVRQVVIFGIMFGYMFFQGIRGTFTYHKFKSPPKAAPTEKDIIPVKRDIDNKSADRKRILWTFGIIAGIAIIIGIGIALNNNKVNYTTPVAVNPERAPVLEAKPKEGWIDRSSALAKAQDWQGLLAHSQRWTQAEPGNEVAWFGLGFAYQHLGRYPEAIPAYREALRLKPDDADAWYNLGLAYSKLGLHKEAIAAYREAVRLKPDYAKAWSNLGAAYELLGRSPDAIAACRKALRLKPDDVEPWITLGASYINLGRNQKAIEACREALRLKPDDADAWYNLGLAYSKLGRHQEAIAAYREAVRLKPDFAWAWNNLGAAYANSGNRSDALEAVKELRRYDPQKADELFNIIMKP
jgi:tetratricopeptide (TPR) repeat protein